MENNKFLPSLFKGMYTAESRVVEWSEVAEIISGESLKSLTEKYRKLMASGMDNDAQKVKRWMPALSPVVQCNGGRRRQHFVGLTGVGMCDFDHLSDVDAAFRTACADPHSFLVYRTISGNGVRVLFRVAQEDFKELPDPKIYRADAPGFAVANEYFSKLLNAEADLKCKNIGRLSVLCHDAGAYTNFNSLPFTVMISKRAEKATSRQVISKQKFSRILNAIKRKLESLGIEYVPGSYNEYVMRTGYYLNSLGVSQEMAEKWAVEHFSDYDEQQVHSIITSCYAKTDEFNTLQISALSTINPNNEKIPYATVEDIENFLRSQGVFRYNVITKKTEFLQINNE